MRRKLHSISEVPNPAAAAVQEEYDELMDEQPAPVNETEDQFPNPSYEQMQGTGQLFSGGHPSNVGEQQEAAQAIAHLEQSANTEHIHIADNNGPKVTHISTDINQEDKKSSRPNMLSEVTLPVEDIAEALPAPKPAPPQPKR